VIGSCFGTCQNFTAGSIHPETGEYSIIYVYHEGGWGARANADGLTAEINPIGNDMNQPVEIFETKFPWRYEEYALNEDSGGPGRQRGGLGIRQRMRSLAETATINLIADRYLRPPWGILGGKSPLPSIGGHYNDFRVQLPTESTFAHATEIFGTESPSKFARKRIPKGTVVENTTTGGGGYGDPYTRELAEVHEDVIDGYVSRGSAQTEYGVVLRDDSTVDVEATNQRRRDGVS